MKKLLCVFLSAIIIFTTLSFTAYAEGETFSATMITFDDQTVDASPNIQGVTFSAGASNTITIADAPKDPAISKIGSTTTGSTASFPTDYNHIDKGNALKLSGSGASTITVNAGILPQNFAVGFDFYSITNTDKITIDIKVGDKTKRILNRNGNTIFHMEEKYGTNPNATGVRVNIFYGQTWEPYELEFDRSGYTDTEPVLAISSLGLRNTPISKGGTSTLRTTAAGNIPIEDYFSDIDLTQPAQIIYTVTPGSGNDLYLDNLSIYDKSAKVSASTYYYDFQNQLPNAQPTYGNWNNSYYWNCSWFYDMSSQKEYYSLASFTNYVTKDPLDNQNKVFKGIRGGGSNIATFEAATKLYVKKPTTNFSLEYKIYISGSQQIKVGAAPGIYELLKGVVPTDARLISGINNSNVLQGGEWKNLWPSKSIGFGEWVKVRVDYDLVNKVYRHYVNGRYWSSSTSSQTPELLAQALQNSTQDYMTIFFMEDINTEGGYFLLDDVKVEIDKPQTRQNDYTFDFENGATLQDNDNLVIGNSATSVSDALILKETDDNNAVAFKGNTTSNIISRMYLHYNKRSDDYKISYRYKTSDLATTSHIVSLYPQPFGGGTAQTLLNLTTTGKVGTVQLENGIWYTISFVIKNSEGTAELYLGDTKISDLTLPTLDSYTAENGMCLTFEPTNKLLAATNTIMFDDITITSLGSGKLYDFADTSYSLANGVISVSGNILSNDTSTKSLLLISALYDNQNNLLAVYSSPTDVTNGTSTPFLTELDAEKAVSGCFIKTMLWSDFSSATPITDFDVLNVN